MDNDRQSRSGQNRHRSGSGQQRGRRPNPSATNIASEILSASGRHFHRTSHFMTFLKSVFAGGFFVIALVFAANLAAATSNEGLRILMLGIGLSTGLFLVVASNAIIATEPNIFIMKNFQDRTILQNFVRLFLFWVIAFLGNWLGAMFFGWLLHYAGSDVGIVKVLRELTPDPSGHADRDLGVLSAIASAFLANWVIGFASMYSTYNRAAMGKILVLFIAVSAIIGAHLQFFPINLAIFTMLKAAGEAHSWFDVIVHNLEPVFIGNLLGAAFLVAMPLLLESKRRRK